MKMQGAGYTASEPRHHIQKQTHISTTISKITEQQKYKNTHHVRPSTQSVTCGAISHAVPGGNQLTCANAHCSVLKLRRGARLLIVKGDTSWSIGRALPRVAAIDLSRQHGKTWQTSTDMMEPGKTCKTRKMCTDMSRTVLTKKRKHSKQNTEPWKKTAHVENKATLKKHAERGQHRKHEKKCKMDHDAKHATLAVCDSMYYHTSPQP